MAVQAFDRPLSLEEAVEAVYQSAMNGAAVIDAAREYAHQIDDRDIYEVVHLKISQMTDLRWRVLPA